MKRLSDRSEGADSDVPREPALTLRSIARVREIDRQLDRIRLARWGIRWIVLPSVAVLAFMVAQGLIATWSAVRLEHVIGGAATLLVTVASCIVASRETEHRVDGFERERSLLLRGTRTSEIRPH